MPSLVIENPRIKNWIRFKLQDLLWFPQFIQKILIVKVWIDHHVSESLFFWKQGYPLFITRSYCSYDAIKEASRLISGQFFSVFDKNENIRSCFSRTCQSRWGGKCSKSEIAANNDATYNNENTNATTSTTIISRSLLVRFELKWPRITRNIYLSQTKCGEGTSCYRDGSNVRCLPDFECMKSKGREVFNHFYNADSITEDLELVSECRRTDDERTTNRLKVRVYQTRTVRVEQV